MIHLVAINTGPRKWTITTSDMREKYELPKVLVPQHLKDDQSIQNWLKGAIEEKEPEK